MLEIQPDLVVQLHACEEAQEPSRDDPDDR
jgi:hypothetical protein